MNDVEDLFIDVYQPRSDKEAGRSINLFPLFLSKKLNLFFRRCFLFHILRIFFELILDFIIHLLSF